MIEECVSIDAPLNKVFDAFADLSHWKRALPDVVQIMYDDGHHQEFLMTVERHGQHETVRGIRYLEPGKRIELFQPSPPPGFRSMTGEWIFVEEGTRTAVSVKRGFTLKEDSAARREEVATMLLGYLRTNLRLFKDYLEHGSD